MGIWVCLTNTPLQCHECRFADFLLIVVTKEEQAWESFSEDEPAPKKLKGQPTTNVSKPAAAAVAAKKGGKPGQGNIMSFFAKK